MTCYVSPGSISAKASQGSRQVSVILVRTQASSKLLSLLYSCSAEFGLPASVSNGATYASQTAVINVLVVVSQTCLLWDVGRGKSDLDEGLSPERTGGESQTRVEND